MDENHPSIPDVLSIAVHGVYAFERSMYCAGADWRWDGHGHIDLWWQTYRSGQTFVHAENVMARVGDENYMPWRRSLVSA
jgi:hypothetical protein